MSAAPEPPVTLILPDTNQPLSIGSPSASTTAAWLRARSTAISTTSDDPIVAKTPTTSPPTAKRGTTMTARQPSGTNHFQFRDHQFALSLTALPESASMHRRADSMRGLGTPRSMRQ